MTPSRLVALASALFAFVGEAVAADVWSQVKAGMTQAQMTRVLGEPLMKSRGRQFELCVYDAGAEVVCFRGKVVAWTAPAGSDQGLGRQLDLSSVLQPEVVAAPPPKKKTYVPRGEDPEINHGFQRTYSRSLRLPRL